MLCVTQNILSIMFASEQKRHRGIKELVYKTNVCVCVCGPTGLKAAHRWEAKQLIVVRGVHVYTLFQCRQTKDPRPSRLKLPQLRRESLKQHWSKHSCCPTPRAAHANLHVNAAKSCSTLAWGRGNTFMVNIIIVIVDFKEAVFQSSYVKKRHCQVQWASYFLCSLSLRVL